MPTCVLLIEPHDDTREALQELMEERGLSCAALQRIDAAIEWLRQNGVPCAVVTSCGPMDVATTRDLARTLRISAETVGVPLIVLTTAAALAPFDDRTTVLPKPISGEPLMSLIAGACKRHREG